jgi:uridine monophosphate synthetase
MSFFSRLSTRTREHHTHLSVGLDPRVSSASELVPHCMRIVEKAFPHAAAFKPNVAFFEAHGSEGVRALEELVAKLPEEVPCLLDAKRGDIGATNEAYGRAAVALGASALTVSPYLGIGALAPFFETTDLDLFVLGRTSNPEAESLQDARLWTGEAVFERVARDVAASAHASRMGLVAGATRPEAIARIRAAAKDSWLLLPGVGTQGGDLGRAVSAARRSDGSGFLVNVSRAVAEAKDPAAYAKELAARIEELRGAPSETDGTATAELHRLRTFRLAEVLFSSEAIRFGSFTLKSGIESPVYVDLRRLVTFPRALAVVADVLAELLGQVSFDRIAALPYAGLPIGTAVALRMDRPLVYPRGQAKTYGAKASIEGLFHAGERVVVLDDIATRGDAKLEALGPLADAGLVVSDVVVLVDREQGARKVLGERGLRLHAAVTLRELVVALAELGKIAASERDRVMAFLSENET